MKIFTLYALQERQHIAAFPGIEASDFIKVRGVKNSRASFQIVLSHEEAFEITGLELPVIKNIQLTGYLAKDVVFEDGSYPDILSPKVSCRVEANTYQSLWIDMFVGKEISAGAYSISVSVLTSLGKQEVKCLLQVYDVTMPEPCEGNFLTEYWIHVVNSWFRWPESNSFDCMKHYFGCEKYSDTWWEINRAMAENMKASRINVLFVRTMDLLFDGGTTVDEAGKVSFRWELFDRWVDWYLEHGSFQKLAGMHLIMQAEGRQVFVIKREEDGKSVLGLAHEDSKEAEMWLEQYLPALYEHIQEKGYLSMWMQHVQDEPADPDSWVKMIPTVHRLLPGIKTLDAADLQSPMPALQGKLDIWIPRVDIYENNRAFYDFRLAQGEQRWTYTCCLPQEKNYANKFIDRPVLHNRVIGWGCFANHFTGFLHWGYDFWDPEGDMFGLNPRALVKGDGFIIYPDAERTSICGSVRLLATRDAAQDYELLYMLAAKAPEKAYELARKVIRRFNDFEWNPLYIEQVRTELLEELERSTR